MGIPYSKEINNAFDELNNAYGQVTPLIEAAYEVLETTKNISLLLAAIQVLTVILLALILVALVALLITLNPDFERERKELVTPTLGWVTAWMGMGWFGWGMVIFVTVTAGAAVMSTTSGRWVQAKVQESVSAGQSRLAKKIEASERKKKGETGDEDGDKGDQEGGEVHK